MAKSTTGSVASGSGGRNGRGLNVLGQPLTGGDARPAGGLPAGIERSDTPAGTYYRAAGSTREFATPELATAFRDRAAATGSPARTVRQARGDANTASNIVPLGRNRVSVEVNGERMEFNDRDLALNARYIGESSARARAARSRGDTREAIDADSDLTYSQDIFRDRLSQLLTQRYRAEAG